MNSINRIVIALCAAAGLLGLTALVLVLRGVFQIATAPASAGSGWFFAFGGMLLVGAGILGGTAFWIRGLNLGSSQIASESDLVKRVRELNSGQANLESLEKSAPIQSAQQTTADGKTDARASSGPEDVRVFEQHWANGARISRRVVRRTPIDSPLEPNVARQQDDTAARPSAAPLPNVLAPDALTLQLARANRLDLGALATNRAGRLSSNQIPTQLESVMVAFLFTIGLLGLVGSATLAFGAISSHNWLGLIASCGIGIALMVGVGLLYNFANRIGADKYMNSARTLVLSVPDVLTGRVASVEGKTTRRMDEHTRNTTAADGSRDTMTTYSYWYCVDNVEISVAEEGYKAFPEAGRVCRLYYLPWSKALVNLQVVQ